MSDRTPILPLALRALLGGAFLVFGLNGFLGFMPNPPMGPEAGAFMGALAATGYMFPLIKGFEVIAGGMILAGFRVPLALLFLAPILVNILAFHLALAPAGSGLVLALVAAEIGLAWLYRDAWRGVLGSVQPRGAALQARGQGSPATSMA
ncbi:MAG: DoxX family protein [Myxococcales bacterium]|nr:DoxX family protein [Myxococcales bacterium]MCB9704901.1 DoxX family protein [Myxococcales bacterium]